MSDPITLSRRAVVAGAGAVLVAGCDVHVPHVALPGPKPADADLPVAEEAVELIGSIMRTIRTNTRRHPALEASLADVLTMHLAHLAALRHAVPTPAPSARTHSEAPVPHSTSEALAQLRSSERPVRARLGGLAQQAHSGDFARLLASMAAAVSQRIEDWPEPPGGESR